MNGTGSKECKTTIRLTEEENIMYTMEAKRRGLAKSEFIRVAVNSYLKSSSNNLVSSVCQLSTVCNQIMERERLDAELRISLEGCVNAVWQQLRSK